MSKINPMSIALAVLVALGTTSCYSETDARNALEAQGGFTDIQVQGRAWFSCSEDDFYATEFTATNSDGKRVSGAVCSGLLLKNATIRY